MADHPLVLHPQLAADAHGIGDLPSLDHPRAGVRSLPAASSTLLLGQRGAAASRSSHRRSESAPAWPHPVWVRLKPRAYDRVTSERFAALLRDTLDLTFRLHIE
jgi:hypothetical protein